MNSISIRCKKCNDENTIAVGYSAGWTASISCGEIGDFLDHHLSNCYNATASRFRFNDFFVTETETEDEEEENELD